MTTLLVLTVGRTDVQLVVDQVRRELSKRGCARLHDELERRKDSWRFVDAPDAKDENGLDTLPAGNLTLCTPKLDGVMRYLVSKRLSPTAALLLETRRDANAAPDDPRAAGTVLEERLKAKGVEKVFRRVYLEGEEQLEDRRRPRDSIIRRQVVRRLEDAVQESLEQVGPARVIVATTGGFPVVSNLVEEIVRLYAAVFVDVLEVADGTRANPPTGDIAVPRTSIPEPITSFQARRRVLELVSEGNLLGARAIAKPLHDDEIENRWTRVVEWLALFSSSLPIPDTCDISVLKHERMAVRAALRVELALRAGDVPSAIHGTVAFFEAALWDGLLEHVERSEEPNRHHYFRFKNGEAPSEQKLLRDNEDSDKERRSKPFELKDTVDGVDWYRIYDGGGGPAARLAKRFLKRPKLAALERAVTNEIRDLRNDVAHNEPTPKLMNEARTKMQEAKLWSDKNTFLSQQLVQDVLRDLGEKNPAALCENLIALVRCRLLEHDMAFSPEER
jgi:hypothetical protein